MKNKQWGMILMGMALLLLNACASSQFFYNESENKTYTELELKKDGSFSELVYYSLGDSLIQEDFGNVLSGRFDFSSDTLKLYYEMEEISAPDLPINEIYIKKEGSLVKLAPITYSHHFLNMVFSPGKSKGLRNLKNYDGIIWK